MSRFVSSYYSPTKEELPPTPIVEVAPEPEVDDALTSTETKPVAEDVTPTKVAAALEVPMAPKKRKRNVSYSARTSVSYAPVMEVAPVKAAPVEQAVVEPVQVTAPVLAAPRSRFVGVIKPVAQVPSEISDVEGEAFRLVSENQLEDLNDLVLYMDIRH